eukprot:gene1813-1959_t
MKYHGFEDEGSVHDLKALTDADLQQMGFRQPAREKFLKAVKTPPTPQWLQDQQQDEEQDLVESIATDTYCDTCVAHAATHCAA